MFSRIKEINYLYLLFTPILLFACNSNSKTSSNNLKPANNNGSLNIDSLEIADTEQNILFFGNSLTAGYGLEEEQSFTFLIQERIDSLGMNYAVLNAGLSGETTAGGNGRIDWVLNQRVDIFVLELGGNDVLRGIDLENTEQNLRNIIEKVRKKKPEVPIIIAGMQAPPNMGPEYTRDFKALYPKLAKEYKTGLIPFFLEGVGGIPALNQNDGIHPNAEGQKVVMENVWGELVKYL